MASKLGNKATAQAPAPDAQPEADEDPKRERFFRVDRTSQVPRGASTYTLPAGKVISSRGYDVTELAKLGVPLTEVESGATPVRARVVPAGAE